MSCIVRTLTPLSCGQAFISIYFYEQIVMLSIDLLHYEDCPHYEEAAQALREVLEEEDVLAE